MTGQVPDEWLAAAARVLGEGGLAGFTVDRVAREAGVSRVTFHRRGIRRRDLIEGLLAGAALDLRSSMLPVLASRESSPARLRRAFEVLCEVSERHDAVLAAVYDVRDPGPEAGVTSGFEFIDPFERLLLDAGEPPGSAAERAEVMVNAVIWTYLHLRRAHRREAARARAAVVALVLGGP
ncbi:MAG: TetR/AcrR family transcriptional regulator [Candidatus Dormibacteraeota bacterium]|nr:TetR/AcrR family transcriptional regulator [Candidatus Dormibacteraeota bacterium]